MLKWISKLTAQQKQLWMIGGSVVLVGSAFKYVYFNFSRGLVVDGMEVTHLAAKKHLGEAREFARWSEKDRQERTPPLSDDQRRGLQAYLDLVAEKQFGEQPRSR